jgi:hypothetical protein
MRRDLSNVASIQSDDGNRIYLSLKREGRHWHIIPSNGDVIEYEFKSRQQALNAIQSLWGFRQWDLQWYV